MEILKILMNGRPQGIYAITKKEEVTDALLDVMNEGKESKEFTKDILNLHLENGMSIIPNSSEPFDWDENIYGKF